MGAPKQKWTPEEEAALRAGVDKYGPGKWRAIQKDPTFGPCLVSRSNVDLKDKWRNMNVGSSGHGSREKSLKVLSRHSMGKAADEPVAAIALTSLAEDYSADDTLGIVDAIVCSDSSKDKKSLGLRYEKLVLEAILGLQDPNGSSAAAIAGYIEEHHPVPSSFRRLLSAKLRDMTVQGKLLKLRQNYKVIDADSLQFKCGVQHNDDGSQTPKGYRDSAKKMRGIIKASKLESQIDKHIQNSDDGKLTPRYSRDVLRKSTGDYVLKKVRVDVDFARSKLKTAEEAARAAALAVAEAEAAAAAAERAAKEAELAEAEAEAAEITADIAALSAKRMHAVAFRAGEFPVAV